MTPLIGRLSKVPLRDVWKHEALDFTRWLEENADVLSQVVGVPLSNIEREQSVGDFSADLWAEDAAGDAVIIENQLERSDHDHLGKLLTYLSALEAKTAIWIVADPRPEHVRAIGWLNESGLAKFYLLKLEAYRIGESAPAPLLTLITGPSVEAARAGEKKKELSERHDLRYKFFESLLDQARPRTKLHATISPSPDGWIGAAAGHGLALNYVVLKQGGRVDLYIDFDRTPTGPGNKALFDFLESRKEPIEHEFASPLRWQRLDDARASRISALFPTGGWHDEASWPFLREALIDGMIRFDQVLRPHWEQFFTLAPNSGK